MFKDLEERIESLGLIDDSHFLLDHLINNESLTDAELISLHDEIYG